nr:uncharacterized protein LOC123766475 [Procambarus clarkii]
MSGDEIDPTVSRLNKQPDKLKLYYKLIQQQQLDNKFIEIVKNDNPKEGNYLPHHTILKDSVTTPIRIVFNCSAKAKVNDTLLNDCLQTDLSLTQRLFNVLLRFHIETYAYTSDIRKAFLRLGLQEEDQNQTKFLWIKDPNDPHSEIFTFRFASVLFEATSPFLLYVTLDTHLKKPLRPHKTEISKNLYVYNFQGTFSDDFKLIEMYH